MEKNGNERGKKEPEAKTENPVALPSHATHRVAVVAIVVVGRVDVGRIEVQVVGVVVRRIRVGSRRPIVAVVT